MSTLSTSLDRGCKQLRDGRVDALGGEFTGHLLDNSAIGIDEQGGGERGDSIRDDKSAVGVAHHLICHIELVGESPNCRGRVLNVDADEADPVPIGLIGLLKGWHLTATRGAGGEPEIDEHRSGLGAEPISARNELTIEIENLSVAQIRTEERCIGADTGLLVFARFIEDHISLWAGHSSTTDEDDDDRKDQSDAGSDPQRAPNPMQNIRALG